MGPAARNQRRPFTAIHRASSVLVFAVLPIVVIFALLGNGLSRGTFLYDFKGGLYGAGKDIVRC
jgi:hypothetical protein